jgi:hypothetical protein
MVLYLKKPSESIEEALVIIRYTEESITLDTREQPHSIFQKRIVEAT